MQSTKVFGTAICLLASLAATYPNASGAQTITRLSAAPSSTEAEVSTSSGKLKTRKDIVSYSIGVTTARNLLKDGVELDAGLLTQGLKDVMGGDKLLLTEKELRSVMSGFLGEMRQKIATNRKEAEQTNKKKSETFLAANAAKSGVQTLPNGLQYRVLKEGNGAKPGDSDTILANYHGSLTSGVEFDGTEDGKPATLKMGNLISGWKEALKLMPAGSHWQVFVPPQLGYGTRGVGSDIGPNEVLVFDIDLVAVK
jgi:FKBP-type peptidyl-prolyl cis-trans isomerase